ncbi:hypothetical protein LTR53_015674 [Teratosphaeriaceae sp. CCFEE 6253]|nr:hypothetical protein LTR53_015674 [Teratosphaeriaceae sp. CCFEE 6253]
MKKQQSLATMSEYWKSTPSYWCKFCATYVKDTPLEKKKHETSGKHQGSIQKNLRDLTKNKEREDRDRQRAKDEVSRLNGLVGGGGKAAATGGDAAIVGAKDVTRSGAPPLPPSAARSAAQRQAHAEQLLALGVALPEELQREVTGVGSWQTTSRRVVDDAPALTLAEMKVKAEQQEDGKELVETEGLARGVRKRQVEDGDGDGDEGAAGARAGWGRSVRRYPAESGAGNEGGLEDLLSGVGRKRDAVKKEESEEKAEVKQEDSADSVSAATAHADQPARSLSAAVKQEVDEPEALPAVVFKKRKIKT